MAIRQVGTATIAHVAAKIIAQPIPPSPGVDGLMISGATPRIADAKKEALTAIKA
jgi:hypothetical protein